MAARFRMSWVVTLSMLSLGASGGESEGVVAKGDLLRAALNGSTAVVQRLLKDGADIEETNQYRMTPLVVASMVGALDVVRILLDEGANVRHGSAQAYTALIFAAYGGYSEIVELLIEHGAGVDRRADTGVSALLAAASSDHSTVRVLLAAGADVKTKDRRGRTPVMLAASTGNVETLDALLDAGAGSTSVSEDGYTALDLAVIYRRGEAIVRLGGDPQAREAVFANALTITDGVEAPTLDKQTRPEFTTDAVTRRVQGSVLLSVIIETSGSIGEVRVVRGVDIGLDLNAIATVREWEFTPGTRDGVPVPVIAEISIDFELL